MNNLGTDLWVCGSVIKKLLDYDNIFGGLDMDEPDRLLLAYDMFKTWSRTNKVRHFDSLVNLFSTKWFQT